MVQPVVWTRLKAWLRENSQTGPYYAKALQSARKLRRWPQYREVSRWLQEYDFILNFYGGIGDDLMCTAILRALRQSQQGKLAILTHYPELFELNMDVDAVLPKRYPQCGFLEHSGSFRFRSLLYAPRLSPDKSKPPTHHVLSILAEQSGVHGKMQLRPWLTLAQHEREAFADYQGAICIQSSTQASRYYHLNKEWGADKFQEVVHQLKGSHRIIQIGSTSDPRLEGAEDLRGRTGLRETASLLSQAALFIGLEGLLMHLARAVETRAVIIYGGRIHPNQIGYSAHENLWSPLSCAPCWQDNECDFHRRCLSMITPKEVTAAAERQLHRNNTPLPTRIVHL